jgi:hypothetical protein
MDRKLNKVIADYIGDFKKNVKEKSLELKFNESQKIQELVEYVFNYD